MAEDKKKPKYRIKKEYLGCDVWTVPPAYSRDGGGKFTLTKDLPEVDLGYLYEVIGHEGIELVK